MARVLERNLSVLHHVDQLEVLWRTFSPVQHVRWLPEGADVFTQDEGSVPDDRRYAIKPGALDLRGDGASVWRKTVLELAEVDLDDVVVGEYTGVLEATRQAIELCEVEKKGCEMEQPFRVTADAFPPGQPDSAQFAAHALITFEPRQSIGRGAAGNVLIRKFRVLQMGNVPRAITEDSV